ncbi:hypothetical protein [uncultured Gordonia sp.]|uniref:hypothetical protein n=1 Tax=uncultured Gordonia sp. TaxID=198437 RepID=UPI0025920034|nr:hypothetical protein [uncultured Gordonia sp.]
MTQSPLTLADRLNRLFALFHNRIEDELPNESAALIIGQRLQRAVDPELLRRARSGQATLPLDVCNELCRLMGVPQFYLQPSPDEATDQLIRSEDANLYLMTLIRDKGVTDMIARGGTAEHIDAVIRALEELPDQPRQSVEPHHLHVVGP